MFRRHLLSLGLSWPFAADGGVCLDQVGAGGGGGAPAGGAAAPDPAGDPGAGADAGADGGADDGTDDAARAAGSGDEDRDDFGGDDEEVTNALPEATLRTRHRRAQRTLAKVRPLADRLRNPQTGQFMTPQELDTILTSHRDFGEIDGVLRRSPQAVEFLMRERQRLDALERGETPAGETDPADLPFNEDDWEFETDTPQGKRLLAMAKSQHELARENRQFRQQLQGVQTGFQQEARTRAEQTWKAATLTAAREITDDTARRWFINNISNQFNELHRTNRLHTVSVDALIGRELKDIRAARARQTRTAITRQSATVAGNGQLPKTPRPGTTAPATGKADTTRETMVHASKSFLARYKS